MKILVTGATGFVGGRLFRELRKLKINGMQPYTYIIGTSRYSDRYPWEIANGDIIKCDLTLEGDVSNLMLRYQPDMVFHFSGDPHIKQSGAQTTLSNYLSTHLLLNYCKKNTRFIFASSCSVYGERYEYIPQKLKEYSECRPRSAYAVAKLASEKLVQVYTQQGLVSGMSVRMAATIGSDATHGLVYDVIRKLESDEPELKLLGKAPGSIKPFTHVSDVVDGIIRLALSQYEGECNLVVEDELSVAEVANIIMGELGIEKPITFLGKKSNWKGDDDRVMVSSQLSRMLVGWKPTFETTEDAIVQTVQEHLSRRRYVNS